MSTSGTYQFTSPTVEQIVVEAYERIGIVPDVLTYRQIQTAITSGNFELSAWINRGLNLFTLKYEMLSIVPNQVTYNLAPYTSDVLSAALRTSNRNLGGTPFSSAGGVAANAFDGNSATACIQNAADGYISYNWNTASYAIQMVGIQSNVTRAYTLLFEYSNDNATWTTAYAPPAQEYTQGVNKWFVVPVPTNGTLFRVRETGGAILNIQELYFNTGIQDRIINRVSYSEYIAYPNKFQTQGPPSLFYVNRQANPTITLWPSPDSQYNNLYYARTEMIQDIGSLINNPDVASRFLEALASGIAYRLAVKQPNFNPQLISVLKEEAELQYTRAAKEDCERVPLRIFGDYMGGWTSV